jgi:selenium-binding protein 1
MRSPCLTPTRRRTGTVRSSAGPTCPPAETTLAKTISAAELAAKVGYSRPHTLHCSPDGIFVSCLGGGNGADGPGGIALLDHGTFDVLRAWETDRGDQYLAYDAWWHLN